MKILFILLIFTFTVAASVPESTIDRLQKIYPDRTRQSFYEVIANSKDSFQLWRAFPAYTYDLIERKILKSVSEKNGFCAGDAHVENFGYLFLEEKKKTIFTINDLDDSANCKLEADLLRLLAGNLFLISNKTEDQIKSYISGVSGVPANFEVIKDLEQESLKKGAQLTKKYKELLESGCSGEFSELNENELNSLKSFMEKTKRKFLRSCARTKENGGSAGIRRYIVFYEKSNEASAIELKPLMLPAPIYHTSISKTERALIFNTAVATLLGEEYLKSYKAVFLNNELFQERPRIGGNVGVELKDYSGERLNKLLNLELHVLGLIHKKSKLDPDSIDKDKIGKLAQELHMSFKKEFGIP